MWACPSLFLSPFPFPYLFLFFWAVCVCVRQYHSAFLAIYRSVSALCDNNALVYLGLGLGLSLDFNLTYNIARPAIMATARETEATYLDDATLAFSPSCSCSYSCFGLVWASCLQCKRAICVKYARSAVLFRWMWHFWMSIEEDTSQYHCK